MSDSTELKSETKQQSLQDIREQLEIDKLKQEIILLQKQTREGPKPTRIEQLTQYLKKHIGQISALIILLGGVLGPLLDFFETERKSQLIKVNTEVLKIFEKDSLNEAFIVNVSLQDPGTVVPFLFNELNHYNPESSKVKPEDVERIYLRMYQTNKDVEYYTLREKISAFFSRSNVSILDDALYKNAKRIFEIPISADKPNQSLITITYLKLIFQTENDEKDKFKKIIDSLKVHCPLNEYKIICRIIEQKK